MLSKRYESTEVDRRTWLHVPSGTPWSTSSDTHQVVESIQHFKSDVINDMDHMRISGTEPSSVILSQRKWFKKLKMYAQNCPNKVKPKGMV